MVVKAEREEVYACKYQNGRLIFAGAAIKKADSGPGPMVVVVMVVDKVAVSLTG